MLCKKCNAVYINGVLCHEKGCPNILKVHKCFGCGFEFTPEEDEYVCEDCRREILYNEE